MSGEKKQPIHGREKRASLGMTLFRETLGLLMITVILVSGAAFILAQHEMTIRVRNELQSLSQEKAAILEETVSRHREQVSILGRNMSPQSIQALTEVIGFRSLMTMTRDGTLTRMAGVDAYLDPDTLIALNKTEKTVFRPIVTDEGWLQYVIAAPQKENAVMQGTLIAVFDATPLARLTLTSEHAGSTAEVLLSDMSNERKSVLRFDDASGRALSVFGSLDMAPMQASEGSQGIVETTDYAGIAVLAAYRNVSSLGWTVIAKIDRFEVTKPIATLALRIGGLGIVIVLFLSLSTFALSRRIVGPLEELAKKLDNLEARRWHFHQTIHTGNELEVVDAAAQQLTSRLRASYEHLEDLVRERTEAVRHEHAEDQAVLQSMDDGLLVTDEQGHVTYINPIAAALLRREDTQGKNAIELLPLITKDGKNVEEPMHPVSVVLRTKMRYAPHPDPEFTLLQNDGTKTPLEIRATPILRGKRSYGAVLVLRDIAEERRVDHMKSEFISLVSHQLRTPLSAMRWYLEMLLSEDAGSLNDDQKEFVGQAAASNSRMVHLVNALLNVSRIELGKFSLSPETINLCELVKTVCTSFTLETKQKKILLETTLQAESIGARSDKGLLVLIIENLISNAIKYSPEGGVVKISITMQEQEKTAIVSVQDSGIGIPEAQQKDIGRKLFRATNARTTDTDGNGLGLYISHVAAESIGAELRFVSGQGKGTTFSLTVPLNPAQS